MLRFLKFIARAAGAGIALAIALSLSLTPLPALAAVKTLTVSADRANLRTAPKLDSEIYATVKKGETVKIYEIRGDWAKVIVGGQKGFMHRDGFAVKESQNASKKEESKKEEPKKAEKPASKYRALTGGSSGKDVLALQNRLIDKGYLAKGADTGRYSSATAKAVKTFQLQNGLTASGKASVATQEKLFSSAARTKKGVVNRDWFKAGINSLLPKRGTAVIVDVKTGARIAIRRVGGHNHADVEPKTAEDTAKLKKLYGSWSWDSRPVILVAGGQYVAAAINGMPHGDEISTTNKFDGQFCLHTLNSRTHGTDTLNARHQANVRVAYEAFH